VLPPPRVHRKPAALACRQFSTTTFKGFEISSKDAVEIFNKLYPDLDRECLVVLLLDMKNRVRGINTVSMGDLSPAITHPREIFKPAILANAASIFMLHNHPSGDPT